jgi:hypothetical protein
VNIFYLDKSPVLAAQMQVNKHVVKMILESAQLLCTSHHMCPKHDLPEKFYKKTHYNHPSAIWARESVDNYKWLCEHAMALCEEYTYRYGKTQGMARLTPLGVLFSGVVITSPIYQMSVLLQSDRQCPMSLSKTTLCHHTGIIISMIRVRISSANGRCDPPLLGGILS